MCIPANFTRTPRGVGAGDAEQALQHGFPRLRAQLDGGGFALQTGDEAVRLGGQLTGHGLPLAQRRQQFGMSQPAHPECGHPVVGGPHLGDRLEQ